MKDLPKRVTVSEVITSRYLPGTRPVSWDLRVPGFEVIRTTSGEEIVLASNGGQSTPAPGWQLLLTKEAQSETNNRVLEWTLYGVTPIGPSSLLRAS